MLYYRRKLALSLLQELGGNVGGTDFQKLLFLFCQPRKEPPYEFVPYRHGCFSFQSFADKRALMKRELLDTNEKRWVLPRTQTIYGNMLNQDDLNEIQRFVIDFRGIRGRRLLHYVYTEYPYFATRSQIAQQVLNKAGMLAVKHAMPKPAGLLLGTIGYEGKNIDNYLNILILHGIQVLCDVRKNPLSMKYGYSKGQLRRSTEALGIEYMHFPELGIESSARKNLDKQIDYDRLFASYERTVLSRSRGQIHILTRLLASPKRIALTCFEADPNKCHRTRVAAAVSRAMRRATAVSHL